MSEPASQESRERAAQLWCETPYTHKVFDPELAESIALLLDRARAELDAWQETAERESRGVAYYRSLVVNIGETIGEAAYIADDGGRADDVLCAKVPELVAAQAALVQRLREALAPLFERMKTGEPITYSVLDYERADEALKLAPATRPRTGEGQNG